MDGSFFGLENPLFSTLQHLVDLPDELEKTFNAPTKTYVRDARAMASTPADVKELPTAYEFVLDMPGVKSNEIKVQIEEDHLLIISGHRRRDEENEKEGGKEKEVGKDKKGGKDKEGSKDKEGGKYLRMERRMGKFMRKFSLPDNANLEAISAVCRDGVLTVTVEKLPPPEPKKPKTIEVKVA